MENNNKKLKKKLISVICAFILLSIAIISYGEISFGWFKMNTKTNSGGMGTNVGVIDVQIDYYVKDNKGTEVALSNDGLFNINNLRPGDIFTVTARINNNSGLDINCDFFIKTFENCEKPVEKVVGVDTNYYYLGSQIKIKSFNKVNLTEDKRLIQTAYPESTIKTPTDIQLSSAPLNIVKGGNTTVDIVFEFVNADIDQSDLKNFALNGGKCSRKIDITYKTV